MVSETGTVFLICTFWFGTSIVDIGCGWASVGFEAFLPNAAQPQSLNRFTMSLMLTCSFGCGVYSLNFDSWLKSLLQPSCWWMNPVQYFQKKNVVFLGWVTLRDTVLKIGLRCVQKDTNMQLVIEKSLKSLFSYNLNLLKLHPTAWSKFVKSTWLGKSSIHSPALHWLLTTINYCSQF